MAEIYISEVKYLSGQTVDFTEIVVTTGTDVFGMFIIPMLRLAAQILLVLLSAQLMAKIDTVSSGTFNGLSKRGGVAIDDTGATYFTQPNPKRCIRAQQRYDGAAATQNSYQ